MLKRIARKSTDIGKQAEQQAKDFLVRKGLQFEKANFYCRGGEIDLIFRDKKQLVFVEVKFRKKQDFGYAEDMITATKKRKIFQAAKVFLHENQLTESVDCRFDVIAINRLSNNNSTSIEWIKDAFHYY